MHALGPWPPLPRVCGPLHALAAQAGRWLGTRPFRLHHSSFPPQDPVGPIHWLCRQGPRTTHAFAKIQFKRWLQEEWILPHAACGWEEPPVHVGLYVEKGVARFATEVEAYALTPEWDWHRLLTRLASGKVARAAGAVARLSGLPVLLFVGAHLTREYASSREDQDWLAWMVSEEGLNPVGRPCLKFGRLGHLRDVRSWDDLAAGLRSLPDAEWYWVDVQVGVPVAMCSAPEQATWTLGDLVTRAVKPWLALL